MSEIPKFTPGNMADILKKKHVPQEISLEEPEEVLSPREGEAVELNGEKYQWTKVPTGNQVWNSQTKQLEPGYHTLRTWFSHHTDGVGAGSGWDGRLRLNGLTSEEMIERYGHVFTRDEISAPGGVWNDETQGVEGGMPDNIFYLELEPSDENRV